MAFSLGRKVATNKVFATKWVKQCLKYLSFSKNPSRTKIVAFSIC